MALVANISSIQLVFDIFMFCSSLSWKVCAELQILPFAKEWDENLMECELPVRQIRYIIILPLLQLSLAASRRLFPVGIYLLKVNNRNTRGRCEICSKLRIKTPERCHWRSSVVFIVNFEHISHLVLVTLNIQLPAGSKWILYFLDANE